MQCKCGGEMRDGTHEVKTLSGASEWFPEVVESDLPLSIYQNTCPGCTRLHFKVKNADGLILKTQG